MKKIEKLTPEQEAYLPIFRKEYFDRATSSKRIDRDKLQNAINDAYIEIGKEKPMLIILQSPMQAMMAIKFMKHFSSKQTGESLGAQLWDQLGDQLRAQLGDQLRDQLGDQLRAQLGDQLRDQLRDQLGGQKDIYDGNYLWGSQDLYWIAWYTFSNKIGVKFTADQSRKLEIMQSIGFECEWWWPYEGICFVSEKPVEINWDDRKLLHAETKAAIKYDDGYSLYAWHGTRIPEDWVIDKKSITPEIALRWGNAEQRRCACEIVGWHNILPMVNAKLIDKDSNPQYGELYEVKHESLGGMRELFLKVECGTGRTFCIPVTNFKQNTAKEANAATYGWKSGLPIEEYLPVIRT